MKRTKALGCNAGMLISAAAFVLAMPVPGWACSGSCTHGEPSLAANHEVVAAPVQGSRMKVLVFSRTTGFRHDSIETGVAAVTKLGQENRFSVDWTEDPNQFTPENLKKYKVVVWLNTTGDVLNPAQESAFESFVRGGGGYVGIHSAADTEYQWAFYGTLVGAYFKSHPQIQPATIQVVDRNHPSTKHLGATWKRTDEWYDYNQVPNPMVKILLKLDTSTYSGHQMGENHPIAWCHSIGRGRAWYTGGGHTKESYAEPDFLKHVLGGILWAARM